MNYLPYTVNNPIHYLSLLETTMEKSSRKEKGSKRLKIDKVKPGFLTPMDKTSEKKWYGTDLSKPGPTPTKVCSSVAKKVKGKDTIDLDNPHDLGRPEFGPRRRYDRANVNFASKYEYCKQVLCEGTTYATFCYERISMDDDDEEYEAEDAFINVYLLLKDFERFVHSRFTNPDAYYKSRVVPQCVLDTFKEHYRTGKARFNEYRLGQLGKNEDK